MVGNFATVCFEGLCRRFNTFVSDSATLAWSRPRGFGALLVWRACMFMVESHKFRDVSYFNFALFLYPVITCLILCY